MSAGEGKGPGANLGKRLLTVEEVAKELGLKKSKVYQFCRSLPNHPLFMPHIRLGQRIYVPKEVVDLWVKKAVEGTLSMEESGDLMEAREKRAKRP
ncbi:helix-turn-helix domain-containing protein [Thermus sp.]|uniref:helix-turn-helix domain-containing protein n=1 Tax=Thermus sp. TaxID=275 RepID=UPI00345CADF6